MTLASANPDIIIGRRKIFNASRDPDHASFKGNLSSIC